MKLLQISMPFASAYLLADRIGRLTIDRMASHPQGRIDQSLNLRQVIFMETGRKILPLVKKPIPPKDAANTGYGKIQGVARLILLNKPYGMLSQFTDRGTMGSNRPTLSEVIDVPGVYPAGRLDMDSEGLLLLTDDGRLQAQIADPRFKLPKTYLVQVEGEVSEESLASLRRGVQLKDGLTRPAEAERIDDPALWPRDPPVRFRKSVPDCWISLTIREGRNRQVRRMTAAIGHPTLRLVRWSIGDWTIQGVQPRTWREVAAGPAALNPAIRKPRYPG